MSESSKEVRTAAIRLPPSHRQALEIIDRFRRFQDLIRHHQKWAHQIQFARPIEALIGDVPPEKQPWIIEQAISRLVYGVWSDLDELGISTVIAVGIVPDHLDPRLLHEKVESKFDLITDYFDIPGQGNHKIFDTTIRVVDEGIGAYSIIAERRKHDRFNPLMWCALVLRAPVFVLHMSGIATGKDAGDKALRFVAWLVGSLAVVILIFMSVKIGVSIPWKAVLKVLPRVS